MTEKRYDEDGWRWYGDKISITTILENAVANPKLSKWYKQTSSGKIDKISTDAASFGTISHEMFASILSGETIQIPQTHQSQVEAFITWADVNKVKHQCLEQTVVSEKLGVAGTCDFIGEINGETVIADWKTGRYRITAGWQMAFYRLAAIEMGLVNPSCGLMGVQIDRKTSEVKTFKYQHINYVEHKFLCALEVFKGLYFNKLSKLNWKWLIDKAA